MNYWRHRKRQAARRAASWSGPLRAWRSGLLRAAAAPLASAVRRGRLRRARAELESAAAGPAVRSPQLARLEAVLFAATEPLSSRRLAEAAGLKDAAEARRLVAELRECYEQDGSAFTVENIAGGWQLRTRAEYWPWLRRFYSRPPHGQKLSQAALETLAIVAYRQPIVRAEIEKIRGVACGEILRQLIERGLVRIVGRDESLGRPLLYGTTRKFLEWVGVASVDELPMADELRRRREEQEPAGEPEHANEEMGRQENQGPPHGPEAGPEAGRAG